MSDENLAELPVTFVEVDGAGGLRLFRSGELPSVNEWVPSFSEDRESDILSWMFLPAGSSYRRRPGAFYTVHGKDGWRVKRDEQTGVPVGLSIDEATARGYLWMRVDLVRKVKRCVDNVDEVSLVVCVSANRRGSVEITWFSHEWQEQHQPHVAEKMASREWTPGRASRDTRKTQPA